jgi:hypothetical protein
MQAAKKILLKIRIHMKQWVLIIPAAKKKKLPEKTEKEEVTREEDAHEVDEEYVKSKGKINDDQHANEAASLKYTRSEEEKEEEGRER